MGPPPVSASLFSSTPKRFSPSPSSTNVGDFRLFSHPNLEVYDEANDDEILYSVVRTMREYANRMGRKKTKRWVPVALLQCNDPDPILIDFDGCSYFSSIP